MALTAATNAKRATNCTKKIDNILKSYPFTLLFGIKNRIQHFVLYLKPTLNAIAMDICCWTLLCKSKNAIEVMLIGVQGPSFISKWHTLVVCAHFESIAMYTHPERTWGALELIVVGHLSTYTNRHFGCCRPNNGVWPTDTDGSGEETIHASSHWNCQTLYSNSTHKSIPTNSQIRVNTHTLCRVHLRHTHLTYMHTPFTCAPSSPKTLRAFAIPFRPCPPRPTTSTTNRDIAL